MLWVEVKVLTFLDSKVEMTISQEKKEAAEVEDAVAEEVPEAVLEVVLKVALDQQRVANLELLKKISQPWVEHSKNKSTTIV